MREIYIFNSGSRKLDSSTTFATKCQKSACCLYHIHFPVPFPPESKCGNSLA